MTKKTTLLFSLSAVLFALLPMNVRAQQLPPFGLGFEQWEVTDIMITMNPDSAAALFLGGNNEHEFEAAFAYEGSLTDTTNLAVTIRLRGNSSLNAFKKSFRINIDGIDNSQEWHGLEKMNLIGLQNDPSLMRSKLCHDAFGAAGVYSARTSYVRLFINGNYMGLYQNQEHIDEEFCKLYFDQQGDGNLYKCTYPATLEFIGSNPELYKATNFGTRIYDLKTNNWRDNYGDLANFISVLNNTPAADLECALPLVFDVETYLKTMAIDVITGNWDNYIYNKNNFYLYHNQLSDQFVYIPYDLDNTFGIDWVGVDWTSRNPYTWQQGTGNRPLFERILEIPAFRQRYTNYLLAYGETILSSSYIENSAESTQSFISSAALDDPYRELDFGFDDNAFLDAISSTWGGHVPYGIAPYTALRNDFLSFQTEMATEDENIIHWLHHPTPTNTLDEDIKIFAFIELNTPVDFQLKISTDNINFSPFTGFNDLGTNGDAAAFDGIFTAVIPNTFTTDQLYYQITRNQGDSYPCEAKMMWLTSPTTGLVINEIMTQNDTYISDEAGEFDDWVELYNPTNTDINLNNYFLTDNIDNPNKFPLPAITLNSGDFLQIWLDDDTDQGQLHSNFEMNSNNNALWLIRTQTSELRIQDHFTPCISAPDASMERATDGGDIIQSTDVPTPGYSNITSIAEFVLPKICAFPNPAADVVKFSASLESAEVRDISGRLLITLNHVQELHVQSFASGMYVIRTSQGQTIPFYVMH